MRGFLAIFAGFLTMRVCVTIAEAGYIDLAVALALIIGSVVGAVLTLTDKETR